MTRTCIKPGCDQDISERHRLARMCFGCSNANALSPVKRLAHLEVARARARGELANPRTLKCADCGGAAIEYDHREYAQPLKVDAVCRSCNLRRGPAIDSPAFHTSRIRPAERRTSKVEG